MLVLTRKIGQTLQLGDDIVLTVLRTRNGQVQIGIDAPAHVNIRRGELEEHPTKKLPPETTAKKNKLHSRLLSSK